MPSNQKQAQEGGCMAARHLTSSGLAIAMVMGLLAGLLWSLPDALAAPSTDGAGPAVWTDNLAPIGPQDWSYDRAAHLLERAGFGGTPEDIQQLANMTPEAAVYRLVYY